MPALTDEDRARLVAALAFALDAHGSQTRKGRETPYVSHLLQVAGKVFEHGGGLDEALAGLLHDCVEDCEDVDASAIAARFGPEVARIVEDCTDTLDGDTPERKSPWKERKTRFLDRLRDAGPATHLVVACDKGHNLADLLGDLRMEGLATLERFSATPGEIRWYYESVFAVLEAGLPTSLRSELEPLVVELGQLVGDAD